jgi:rubrerythrin
VKNVIVGVMEDYDGRTVEVVADYDAVCVGTYKFTPVSLIRLRAFLEAAEARAWAAHRAIPAEDQAFPGIFSDVSESYYFCNSCGFIITVGTTYVGVMYAGASMFAKYHSPCFEKLSPRPWQCKSCGSVWTAYPVDGVGKPICRQCDLVDLASRDVMLMA